MKETQNSELSKAKKTAATEQKKTTPPTSQTKQNTQKAKSTNAAPRKRVRPLQTAGQRSYDENLDEALDVALDEFIDTDFSMTEEIPVDAPEEIQNQPKPTNLLQRMKLRREA